MKEIRKTTQFKKDYKRFKNDKENANEGHKISAITLMGTSPEVILSEVE